MIKRLRLIMAIFALCLCLPLGIMTFHTYRGLRQEETARLRFFGDALFDRMERQLAELILREESRPVDAYNMTVSPDGQGSLPSPIARPPEEAYILGYLQNNPDGTYQTPMDPQQTAAPDTAEALARELRDVNRIFNQKRFLQSATTRPAPLPEAKTQRKADAKGFADQFLRKAAPSPEGDYLGRKQKRVEQITAGQALNIQSRPTRVQDSAESESTERQVRAAPRASHSIAAESMALQENAPDHPGGPSPHPPSLRFQVEVAPFQSVLVGSGRVFVFRRILMEDRVYRQGFVIDAAQLMQDLAQHHFSQQPMAHFSHLQLAVSGSQGSLAPTHWGAPINRTVFSLERQFPVPFDFLSATLTCEHIPRSASRPILNFTLLALAMVVLVGLWAIQRNTAAVAELSERRARFVSSVTHELKTPLTNIRMYVEMLQEGIAASIEREQAYFQVLGSESARLSRLINNVLELSQLEKQQRRFNISEGSFGEVLDRLHQVMTEKLTQEGFRLRVETVNWRRFHYDGEVMLQILINLMENSMKFSRNAQRRDIVIRMAQDAGQTRIQVMDFGPGIPRKALSRIFDDFYRADTPQTRSTSGTGIGLALVKRFMTAMGGQVTAANNPHAGCTITLTLPT